MDNRKSQVLLLGVVVTVLIAAVLKLLSGFLIPLVIAMLIAFALMPLSSFLRRRKIPNWIGIVLTLLIVLVTFYLIAFFMYSSINTVIKEFPRYYSRAGVLTDQLFSWLQTRFNLNVPSILKDINWLTPVRNMLFSLSGGSLDFLKSLGVVILFLIFFLIESPLFQKTIRKAFPRETSHRLIRVYMHITREIGRYLSLKLLISLATGIFVFGTLFLIGMDFAFIWGVLAFILNFIPSIGSIIVMAGTILMSIFQFFPDAGKIFLVAFSMVSIQIILGNFLDPRLSGDRLKLSPLLILLSLFIWNWIWGIAGMFLAVPLLSVIKIICENIPQLAPVAVILENGRGAGISRRQKPASPSPSRQRKQNRPPS